MSVEGIGMSSRQLQHLQLATADAAESDAVVDEGDDDLNDERISGNTRLERCLRRFLAACIDDDNDDSAELLFQLRRHLLLFGADEPDHRAMSVRGLVWKALLDVERVSVDRYVNLIKQGPCKQYQKIRGDSFRTFPGDHLFQARVPENAIIRLLNSFVHESGADGFKYLQGMNAVSGPFLYCMGELDAHASFTEFVKVYCPMYWVPKMWGARAGCALVDSVLHAVDPELFSYLRTRNLFAVLYGFAPVSSFSCCLQPFSEVLKLWDFLIGFGLHHNIVAIVAQVVLVRDQLFAVSNPIQILNYRKWPSLDARTTIALTLNLITQLSPALYESIQKHCYVRTACDQVNNGLHCPPAPKPTC